MKINLLPLGEASTSIWQSTNREKKCVIGGIGKTIRYVGLVKACAKSLREGITCTVLAVNIPDMNYFNKITLSCVCVVHCTFDIYKDRNLLFHYCMYCRVSQKKTFLENALPKGKK